MASQDVNIYIKARDAASAAFHSVEASARRMSKTIGGIRQVAGIAAAAVAAFMGGFKIGSVIAETGFSIDGLKKKVTEFWKNATDARYQHMQAIGEGQFTVFQENAIQKASREANEKLMGIDPASKEREAFLKRQEARAVQDIKDKDNYIKALQEEADAIGKTRYELDLMFLASKNAEQQDYDLVQSMHERIRANEDAKKSEMDLADELERIEQRRRATQELRTFEESMAQRRISRQIDDLRSQQRGGGGQTPELMATESRFLSRGTVRSKDPIASALQKQIEKLEEQLKSMQRQEEELEEIRKNTMLQEALVGI